LIGRQHEKGKRKRKRKEKLLKLTGSLHYCTLLSKEFLLFLPMPIPIKTVMPVRTMITIHLIVFFAVHTFEDMRTWLTNLGG